MIDLDITSTVKLNNDIDIPILGLGTWTLNGNNAYQAVLWALEAGYRLIDTATIYGNERKIGQAIVESGVPREEIFITTKVWNSDQGYNNTFDAFNNSLKNLNLTYIDLYLIHWPISKLRDETWKALEKLLKEGKARAIGVSNYTIRHLKEHLDNFSVIPSVNQVEFSPFLYQKDLLDYCVSKGIILEAYSPLTRSRKLNTPEIETIGKKYNKTPAQILIRWGLQHNIIEIPKSGNKDHIYENAKVFDFELTVDDMKNLDNLNQDFRIGSDPSTYK